MLADCLLRFSLVNIYTTRIYTDTEGCFIIEDHSSDLVGASRVGIIKCIYTEQPSEQGKSYAPDSQRGRHTSIQLQALQYTFKKDVAVEGASNGETEFSTRPGGTVILSIAILTPHLSASEHVQDGDDLKLC